MFSEGYIGYTSRTPFERFCEHKSDSEKPSRSKYPLHNAILKYGELLTVVTLVEGNEEYCLSLEYKLRPTKGLGWNLVPGGGIPPSNKGVARSKEACAKASASLRSFYLNESEEDRNRRLANQRAVGATLVGRKMSEESRKKGAEARSGLSHMMFSHLTGVENITDEMIAKAKADWGIRCKSYTPRLHTEVAKKKMSDACKERFKNPWNVHNCKKDVWAIANEIYQHFINNPTQRGTVIGKSFGLPESSVKTLLKKFQDGWVPLSDADYIEWLNNYKSEQGTR